MTRKLLTLLGIAVLTAAIGLSARAQDTREWLTDALAGQLVITGVIEAERSRRGVPRDFAENRLADSRARADDFRARADAIGQGAEVRRDAARAAQRILSSGRRSAVLEGFPEPGRVKADLAADAQGADEVTLLARQVGRLAMLNIALTNLTDQVPTERPPDVFRLQQVYLAHAADLRDRALPRLGDCRTSARCRRGDFGMVMTEYTWGEAQARETASLYLPARVHDDFFIATRPAGVEPIAEPAAEPSFGWPDLLPSLGGLLGAGVLLGLLVLALKLLPARVKERTSGNYGTADYAPFREAMNDPQSLLHGAYLGMSAYPGPARATRGAPILTTPGAHTLVVAPTGTGKGTRVIVPTLLLYQGSVVVIDPKGENTAITARFRRDRLGHAVHIINPWGELDATYAAAGFAAATFNPLDVLRSDDPNVVSIARSMAEQIVISGPTPDPFWQRSAASLLTALLLWVTDQGGPGKTLGGIADLLSGGEKMEDLRPTLFADMAGSTAYEGAMRKQIAQFMTMGDRQYGSVISQLADALQFAADPLLVKATSTSSFSLRSLVDGKTSVFIVIPDDQMQPQAAWLRLLLAAVTETFKREKPAARGVRGMFVIDEFPALGRIDRFIRDVAIMRGAGLDYTIAIQSLSQLRDIYGTAAETILGNCKWKWFCNVNDLATAEYLSRAIGQMTVQTVSRTLSAGQAGEGRTLGETGRALLFPDEIMALGPRIAFAFNPTERPHYLTPIEYWELEQHVRPHAVAHGLSIPDLTAYDHNPYRPKSDRQERAGQGTNGDTGSDPKGKRRKSAGEAPRPSQAMSRADALDILGLKEGASAADIAAAYTSRMKQLHPDRPGGSTRLVQQVNQARDVLLPRKG